MSPLTQRQPESPDPVKTFAEDTVAAFLRAVFAGQQHGVLVLYTIPDHKPAFFDISTSEWLQRSAAAAIRVRATQNVYFGLGTQKTKPERGRGGAETVIAIPGLWADIDVKGPCHVSDEYPPTFSDAWKIIDSVPFKPTLVVQSGYGLQPYWLFREPWEFESKEDRQTATGLSRAFQAHLQKFANELGWKVDPTSDLARILRVPGTFNRKAEEPALVRFELSDGEPRYNPSEFMEWLDFENDPQLAAAASSSSAPGDANLGADFGRIVGACRWMNHCVADAAILPEPEWYRALGVAARCRGGNEIAHEISKAHSKYTPAETEAKLKQSTERSRATRCAYVAGHFDSSGEYCRQCQHRGLINSPVKLGFSARIQRATESDEPSVDAEQDPLDKVRSEVVEAIEQNDIGRVFLIADRLIALPESELAALKARLTEKFKRSFRVADFNKVIKDERAKVASVERLSRPDWERELLLSQFGTPKPILANAITALRLAPEWENVLAFDEFALKTIATNQPPFKTSKTGKPWDDDEYRRTAEWLQHRGITVAPQVAWQAIETVARERAFHPVREYLKKLHWDGVKRLDQWLALYLGVENNDYTRAVGERWMISAIARIFEPGVKADCCLILEGKQGEGKSTALSVLGGEWFTDELGDLDSKDASMQTHGVWIIEIAELSSISRSDVGRIKAFMSRRIDRFRPPYGHGVIEAPRQCVFAGTVNHESYLKDETGARRFWPVMVDGRYKEEQLRRDRDQLWAEALVGYRKQQRWWLDTPDLVKLAEDEQQQRYEGDAWDDLIREWLRDPKPAKDRQHEPFISDPSRVTVQEILTHCIGKRQEQWTQIDQNRVVRALKSMGWEVHQSRKGEKKCKVYVPKPGSEFDVTLVSDVS
jgi:predicted P-loop ATPase